MFNGNHSPFGKGQALYQEHKIGKKSDRLGSHCNCSSVRMSFKNLGTNNSDFCFFPTGDTKRCVPSWTEGLRWCVPLPVLEIRDLGRCLRG